MKNACLNMSLCTTDAKVYVKKSSSGELFLAAIIFGKKKLDEYGNDLSMMLDLPEAERKALPKPIYVGDGRYVDFTKLDGTEKTKEQLAAEWQPRLVNKMVKVQINLSKIPKEAFREADNGKKYVGISILSAKDKPGILYVQLQQTKEQREAKAERIFIGTAELLPFRESIEKMEVASPEELSHL